MNRRLTVDWGDWSFGPGRHPVVGSALAGASALSVTMLGELTGWLVAWWPLLAGGMLGLAGAVTGAWQAVPGAAVAYRAGCWLAAGGWSAATLHWASPWTRWPLVILATGVTLTAVVGRGLVWLEARQQPDETTDEQPTPGLDPLAAKWEVKLREITRRQVSVLRLVWWEPRTGFTLHCRLPGDGTTLADIKAFEAQLAAAANLPPGCNVEVLAGPGGRRSVRIRVAVENAMAQVQPMPADTGPLSIDRPLPLGVHADRTEAAVSLRYACGVLVGQTDSGKSNTLNVITHQLVRCPDVIVWAIDCSGAGRFPRPWIRAWREGEADRPAIDWAAATGDEALAMCHAAINIINGRTAAYERLMHERNVDLIPAGPDLPQIVILADEYADLPEPVKAALETISNTGRGAAARVVSSVLRATGQYISRAMIVQARERIAMRVSDEAELQYLFDQQWGRGRVDPASVPYQGSGLISTGTAPIAPFKAWRLEPADITRVSLAVAELRPELDEISAGLAGPAYPGRWERTPAAHVPRRHHRARRTAPAGGRRHCHPGPTGGGDREPGRVREGPATQGRRCPRRPRAGRSSAAGGRLVRGGGLAGRGRTRRGTAGGAAAGADAAARAGAPPRRDRTAGGVAAATRRGPPDRRADRHHVDAPGR